MPACSAFGCTNTPSKKIPGLTFHRFPLDEKRRKAWIMAVRRANWTPSKSATLCSEHFAEDQLDRTSLVCTRLRDNAIPTIFKGFPPHLRKVTKQRKPPMERTFHSPSPVVISLVESLQPIKVEPDSDARNDEGSNNTVAVSSDLPQPSITHSEPQSSTDSPPPSTCSSYTQTESCPTEMALKRKLLHYEETLARYRKKIKTLQSSGRRQRKRIEHLLSVLKEWRPGTPDSL